jgi:hypothetical protein
MTTITHIPGFVLPVPPGRWPPPADGVRLDGLAFDPKPELHVTLVGSALGRELLATFGGSTIALVDAARDAIDWRFERGGRRLLLRKTLIEHGHTTVAHSIIELVDLPAMACFHRRLGRLLGRQLPVPPPHVTLHTAGRVQGIGVSSPARLRAFTVRMVAAKEVAGAQART